MAATSDYLINLALGTPNNACLTHRSAFFRAAKQAGARPPLLIFSPCLALGTPKSAGATYRFHPLLSHQASTGETAPSDGMPALGVGEPLKCRGCVAIPLSFGPLCKQG